MGRQLVPKVLLTVFLRVSQAVVLHAAVMLPKQARGTFRKHVTKPSEQVAAPLSILSLSRFGQVANSELISIFSSLNLLSLSCHSFGMFVGVLC